MYNSTSQYGLYNHRRLEFERISKPKGDQDLKEEEYSKDDEAKKQRIGLTNQFNTCFINCSMQCLSNIPELAYFYVSKPANKFQGLHRQIAKLIEAMWCQRSSHIYDMKFFCEEVYNTFELYRSHRYRQMDSPEFIQNILNFIQQQCTKNDIKDIIRQVFQGSFHSTIICKKKDKKQFQCNQQIVNISQKFLSIPLTVVQYDKVKKQQQKLFYQYQYCSPIYSAFRSSRIKLLTCLKNFSKPINLKGQDRWFCKRCQQETECQKCMRIQKIGMVLIIHLLRFVGEEKYGQVIEYPEELHQSQIIRNGSEKVKYKLIGVICHMGRTIKGGHYYCYNYDEGKRAWYRYNDTFVSESRGWEHLENENAYVLFYRRQYE